MASQSILTGIRRLWEYMTVPSYGNIPIDIEEEHDPVREFLERQSRGGVSDEVADGADVLPEEKPGSKVARSRQPDTADTGPPPTEVAIPNSDANLSDLESEAPLEVDDDVPEKTESRVPQDVSDSDEERENEVRSTVTDTTPEDYKSEVSKMTVEEEHHEAEQIEGEQKEEAQQGGNDDVMDIFRTEKEIKEKDIIQEILIDIDARDLLEESRELIAELNTRRYGKA